MKSAAVFRCQYHPGRSIFANIISASEAAAKAAGSSSRSDCVLVRMSAESDTMGYQDEQVSLLTRKSMNHVPGYATVQVLWLQRYTCCATCYQCITQAPT
eukprot:TRINITY_DN1515_c0_g1_i2.p1 TRINITY_DN1515_c0_g1~~TRINITY_DN1515_c0_g1_i2.p1  ORF type:complete len:100 (+),score=8.13 TRINITY_DN1515_c0_g1_i2:1006-1305(+)